MRDQASASSLRVLVVDLNNFARYPSIAIGALVGALRREAIDVDVFSPLSIGIPGVPRETRAQPWGRIDEFVRHATANAASPTLRALRARLAERRHPLGAGHEQRIIAEIASALDRGYDAVLLSAYLLYRSAVEKIASLCASRGVPVVLGGPYFAQPEVIDAWRGIPGVDALFAGEAERCVGRLVETVVEGLDASSIHGVSTARVRGAAAPPLGDLDSLAFPDYRDFPWQRYPKRIVPIITGRGCGWGACTFCSDITSSMGRSMRTRSAGNVLAELTHQSQLHATECFVFTDLKMNSHLPTWYGLLDGIDNAAPGAQWIGSVHIAGRGENGLERENLKRAAAAGMVRLTTGLESGSPRVLESMDKGADLERSERTLRDAAEAGISVRLTMIVGHPGERPQDVEQSAAFLARNTQWIDRVLLNRFAMITGTRIHRRLRRGFPARKTLDDLVADPSSATVSHRYTPASSRAYQRALWNLLGATHTINRRRLGIAARAFEGVM